MLDKYVKLKVSCGNSRLTTWNGRMRVGPPTKESKAAFSTVSLQCSQFMKRCRDVSLPWIGRERIAPLDRMDDISNAFIMYKATHDAAVDLLISLKPDNFEQVYRADWYERDQFFMRMDIIVFDVEYELAKKFGMKVTLNGYEDV